MRVVIVDDHPLVLAGLSFALERNGIVVVGQATTCADAIRCVKEARPDAVVLDVVLPDGNGVDACRTIMQSAGCQPAVLLLTTYDEPLLFEAARRAGARGVVSKECDPGELAELLVKLVADPNTNGFPPRQFPELTPRERSVLKGMLLGQTLADIASSLQIGDATVKDYAGRLYAKFDVRDRHELVFRLGRLAPDLMDAL